MFIAGTKSIVTEEIQVVPNGYQFLPELHIDIEKLINSVKHTVHKNIRLGSEALSRRPGPVLRPLSVRMPIVSHTPNVYSM